MKRLQNFSALFSKVNLSDSQLPKIRKTAGISRHAVRKRVLDALEPEPVPEKIRRKSLAKRTIAIAAAAAVAVSGGALTVVAANGGFQTLAQIVFGKDTTYPDSVETLYAVPEANITDTCDAVDCQVLGVFGDASTVTVVLDFFGVNGYTLPEDLCFYPDGSMFDAFQTQSDSVKCSDGFGTESWSYDSADNGHLYLTKTTTFQNGNPSDGSMEYTFHSGILLHDSGNRSSSRIYQQVYSMSAIRSWLGQTIAEINAEKAFSAEEEVRIAENFLDVSEDTNGDGVISDAERQYIPKEDIYAEGSISLEFSLEYPVAEPVTRSFTYTDPETGSETPMELQLSPWGASFTWSAADPMPSFENRYVTEGSTLFISAMGDAVSSDTTENHTESGEQPSGSTTWNSELEPNQVRLNLTFRQPVDPKQVTAVYYGDIEIWASDDGA